jgi:hypothetical protein
MRNDIMKKTKLIASLVITAIAVGAISAGAYSYYKSINVEPGPSLLIDKQTFIPKDANGNIVETFIYNGTTYVPIRAISEAFDKKVDYNSLLNRVEITTPMITEDSVDFLKYSQYMQIMLQGNRIFNELATAESIYHSYSNYYQANGKVTISKNDINYVTNQYKSLKEINDGLKSNITYFKLISTDLFWELNDISNLIGKLEDMIDVYYDICDKLDNYSPSSYDFGSFAQNTISRSCDSAYDNYTYIINYSRNMQEIEERLSNGIIDY